MNNTNEIIYKSLSDLEKNLQEIKSANEQVKDVVSSSEAISKVIESYQHSFEGLSKNVKSILKDSTDFSAETISKLSEQVDVFKLEVNKLSNLNIEASIKNIEKEVVLQFNKDLKKQLEHIDSKNIEFQSKINEFKDQINRIEKMKLDILVNEVALSINNKINTFELIINEKIDSLINIEKDTLKKIQSQNTKIKIIFVILFVLIMLSILSILVPLKLKKII